MYSYINHKNIPALRAFFPNMRIEELDAGHWGMSYKIVLGIQWLNSMLYCSTRGEAQRVSETPCWISEQLSLMESIRSTLALRSRPANTSLGSVYFVIDFFNHSADFE